MISHHYQLLPGSMRVWVTSEPQSLNTYHSFELEGTFSPTPSPSVIIIFILQVSVELTFSQGPSLAPCAHRALKLVVCQYPILLHRNSHSVISQLSAWYLSPSLDSMFHEGRTACILSTALFSGAIIVIGHCRKSINNYWVNEEMIINI